MLASFKTNHCVECRLTLHEQVADAILRHSATNPRTTKLCLQLALKIYVALGCHVPTMVCMVRLGQFDRLTEYVQLHDCSVGDVTQVKLHNISWFYVRRYIAPLTAAWAQPVTWAMSAVRIMVRWVRIQNRNSTLDSVQTKLNVILIVRFICIVAKLLDCTNQL